VASTDDPDLARAAVAGELIGARVQIVGTRVER
jgi:hypothetical protein